VFVLFINYELIYKVSSLLRKEKKHNSPFLLSHIRLTKRREKNGELLIPKHRISHCFSISCDNNFKIFFLSCWHNYSYIFADIFLVKRMYSIHALLPWYNQAYRRIKHVFRSFYDTKKKKRRCSLYIERNKNIFVLIELYTGCMKNSPI